MSHTEILDPPTYGIVAEWRKHPRLQRHAQRFHHHTHQASVLKRYLRVLSTGDSSQLSRCICHVGAWVALLPADVVAIPLLDTGYSAVSLFAHMLRSFGNRSMTGWLRGILHLVESRLQDFGGLEANSHWAYLERSLQQRLMRTSVVLGPGATTRQQNHSVELSGMASKRLRLFNRDSCHWAHSDASELNAALAQCRAALLNLSGDPDQDARTLRTILRTTVAMLAPPRINTEAVAPSHAVDTSVTDIANVSVRHQRKIRKLIAKILETWRLRWSDDSQLVPMLNHLRHMIVSFEERAGSVSHACASAEWAALKRACMNGFVPKEATTAGARPQRSYDNSRGSGQGHLQQLAIVAMQRLGGKATSDEIVAKICSDPELWARAVSGNLNRKIMSKDACRKRRGMEIWEHSVRSRMSRLFCKSDVRGVWQVRRNE